MGEVEVDEFDTSGLPTLTRVSSAKAGRMPTVRISGLGKLVWSGSRDGVDLSLRIVSNASPSPARQSHSDREGFGREGVPGGVAAGNLYVQRTS